MKILFYTGLAASLTVVGSGFEALSTVPLSPVDHSFPVPSKVIHTPRGGARVDPARIKILRSFGTSNGANATGANPYGGVIQGKNGNLYGTTTFGGGGNNLGTVYSMKPDGTLFKSVKLTFAKGTRPFFTLLEGSDGNFYGPASRGGSADLGTVLKLTPTGIVTALFTFTNSTQQGEVPTGRLIQAANGNFYGTTRGGGSGLACGTAFQLTPSGQFTQLIDFQCIVQSPNAGVIQGNDGNFYGTSEFGGSPSQGTIFRVRPTGALKILRAFNASNGAKPLSGLVQGSDGNFYGTTAQGGSSKNAGTVFRMTPAGQLTVLWRFNGTNGKQPTGTLLPSGDGGFYGTTAQGGVDDKGTIFKIIPGTPSTFTTLVNFGNTRAANPYAGLSLGKNGNLYGTTVNGGRFGVGTVYQLILP